MTAAEQNLFGPPAAVGASAPGVKAPTASSSENIFAAPAAPPKPSVHLAGLLDDAPATREKDDAPAPSADGDLFGAARSKPLFGDDRARKGGSLFGDSGTGGSAGGGGLFDD